MPTKVSALKLKKKPNLLFFWNGYVMCVAHNMNSRYFVEWHYIIVDT